MAVPRSHWSIVNVLLVLVVSTASPAADEAAKGKSAGAAASQASMEVQAQKQREATRAAMQASIEKQRAAVRGLPAGASTAESRPFFDLPPVAPFESGFFAMNANSAANCEPAPDAEVVPAFHEAARREGLQPELLAAVIRQESAFRPCAVSEKGAQGLMQLMPATVAEFGVKDPFDIKQNIDAGAKYLKQLLGRYDGDLAKALGAYNAGPGRVDAAGGVPPIPETTAYVDEILKSLREPPATPKLAEIK